jgi:peptidoglycan/LPS O-acetylase OafA/YrhL
MRQLLAPYQRITSGRHLIPEIDGLRFVAIAGVYLYHLAGDVLKHSLVQPPPMTPVFEVTQWLNVGVPLFFVISGFILGLPFATARRTAQPAPGLGAYYRRRLTRLEPPYLAALLLLFVVKIATGRSTIAALTPNLIASALYVHNIDFGRPSDVNFVAWSLEIEVQFYCLAPLLAMVFAIESAALRRGTLAAMIVAASAISASLPAAPVWHLTLLAHLQYFLAGFLLTEWYLDSRNRTRAARWDVAGLAVACGSVALFSAAGPASVIALPWLMMVFVVAAFRGSLTNMLLTNIVITTIGGMCYSIYLLHNYAVSAVGAVTGGIGVEHSLLARLGLQFLLITPPVLMVSAAFFRLIERPCMRPDWTSRLLAPTATPLTSSRTARGQ